MPRNKTRCLANLKVLIAKVFHGYQAFLLFAHPQFTLFAQSAGAVEYTSAEG